MKIGVPKEIKNHEYRVGLVPSSVQDLVANGHEVLVETTAGEGVGFSDEEYCQVGATIVSDAKSVFDQAVLIVKVKEPQLHECAMLKSHQTLFTYLHLAADKAQAEALQASGATAIAYETVTSDHGRLPLLTPMSEVAGRMSVQVGAYALQKASGGAGVLLGGVSGVEPAKVVVLGGGVAGTNAAEMAVGLKADVVVLDKSVDRLRELQFAFGNTIKAVYSNAQALEKHVVDADLVIGSVLIPGAAAPKLVTRAMVSRMRKGSAMVDISIDQGGCFETSKPTTHAEPTYVVDGVVHYCVTNMPGAVARTAAVALNNVTLRYVKNLANMGTAQAIEEDIHLRAGVNVEGGKITHAAVAEALNL
ncbi:MAG: alanine dehydrogenase [Myxococcota bacterium]|nr:alanine dehydrogenase [Myxococcota bacterium]